MGISHSKRATNLINTKWLVTQWLHYNLHKDDFLTKTLAEIVELIQKVCNIIQIPPISEKEIFAAVSSTDEISISKDVNKCKAMDNVATQLKIQLHVSLSEFLLLVYKLMNNRNLNHTQLSNSINYCPKSSSTASGEIIELQYNNQLTINGISLQLAFVVWGNKFHCSTIPITEDTLLNAIIRDNRDNERGATFIDGTNEYFLESVLKQGDSDANKCRTFISPASYNIRIHSEMALEHLICKPTEWLIIFPKFFGLSSFGIGCKLLPLSDKQTDVLLSNILEPLETLVGLGSQRATHINPITQADESEIVSARHALYCINVICCLLSKRQAHRIIAAITDKARLYDFSLHDILMDLCPVFNLCCLADANQQSVKLYFEHFTKTLLSSGNQLTASIEVIIDSLQQIDAANANSPAASTVLHEVVRLFENQNTQKELLIAKKMEMMLPLIATMLEFKNIKVHVTKAHLQLIHSLDANYGRNEIYKQRILCALQNEELPTVSIFGRVDSRYRMPQELQLRVGSTICTLARVYIPLLLATDIVIKLRIKETNQSGAVAVPFGEYMVLSMARVSRVHNLPYPQNIAQRIINKLSNNQPVSVQDRYVTFSREQLGNGVQKPTDPCFMRNSSYAGAGSAVIDKCMILLLVSNRNHYCNIGLLPAEIRHMIFTWLAKLATPPPCYFEMVPFNTTKAVAELTKYGKAKIQLPLDFAGHPYSFELFGWTGEATNSETNSNVEVTVSLKCKINKNVKRSVSVCSIPGKHGLLLPINCSANIYSSTYFC